MLTIDQHELKPRFWTLLLLAEAVSLLASISTRAHSGVLGIQAQTDYEYDEVDGRDTGKSGRGYIATTYSLSLRRRFTPASTLMSDFSINGSGNGGSNGTQNANGWTLNLLSDEAKYMLTGRVVHNRYSSSYGTGGTSQGSTTYYNVGVYIRQPAYPVVSVQLQRSVSGTTYAGLYSGANTSTWLTSLAYSAAPIRFSLDRSQQSISSSTSTGSHVNSQTEAITLDQPLMQGLSVFGELSRTGSEVSFATGSTSTSTSRRTLRLTANPTRSVVAEVDLASEADSQRVSRATGNNSANTVGWSVRSEVLPGLNLDLADQRQTQNGDGLYTGLDSVTHNRNLDLAARLTENTVLSATVSRIGFGSPFQGGDVSQNSTQTSLQTCLSRYTDLNVNYGKNTSNTGLSDRFTSTSEGVSIRDRRSSRVSIGAAYRHMVISSIAATADSFDQKGDAVDLDMLCQPGYTMSFGLRLSYQNNTGSSSFRTVSPGANIRLQLDPATNLTASWTTQRFRQYDPTVAASFGQDTRGISARLTHTFVNGSYLDVAYDFQGNSVSDIKWRRQLRLGFTVNR